MMPSPSDNEVKTSSPNPGQEPPEKLQDIQAGTPRLFRKQYLLVCQQRLSGFPSKG
jgi:hypothetical protein